MTNLTIRALEVGNLAANSYVVCKADEQSNRAIIVDPGAEPDKIVSEVEKAGLIVDCILLTHGHADHIGGVTFIRDAFDCQVVVHSQDAAMLTDPIRNLSSWLDKPESVGEPDKSVQDGESFFAAGIEVKVIHTPGHTPGSVCYLLEDCLFSGDTLFAGSIGRVDFPGSSRDDMQLSLQKMQRLNHALRVFPGHGPSTTIADEIATNPFLRGGIF